MKKFISLILSTTILLTTFSVGFTAYADVIEEKTIDNFIESTCDVIRDYDADKEFEVIDDDSLDFQTCRLIVKSNGGFNTYGAVENIKGFDGFNILQYDNEKSTKSAYNNLQSENNVLSVSIDKVISPLQSEDEEEDTSTDVFPDSTNGHLCDWATERTQTAQVNEYIKDNNVPLKNVTVGVVDSGVDYNHEFLQGRIVRTSFNSSSNGQENDELDLVNGHGTAVSSVIVDNTPNSVSVAVYRVVNDDGLTSDVYSVLGILQAVQDNVDIINCSFGGAESDDGLTDSAVNLAYEKNIAVVSCAGNAGNDIELASEKPANCVNSISVSATSEDNRNCFWSNHGLTVDISAPGEKINVAVPNNRYDIYSGTSFSSPCIAGIVALIKSAYYQYSYDDILELLKDNSISLETYYSNAVVSNETIDIDKFKLIKSQYDEYGKGLVQIGEIFGLSEVQSPKINLTSGNYADKITVEISSESPVYYTVDGSYPSVSSTLYTEPLTITEDTDLRAIAYDNSLLLKYSNEVECEYQIFQTGTDDMFDIDENGCITSYRGNITNLLVPDTINGIEVKSFTSKIFNDDNLTKLVLPNTISEIPNSAFAKNETIQYIDTGGAKIIQGSSFLHCKALYTIDMPNVESIESEAFNQCIGKYAMDFLVNAPNLKCIKTNGFYICSSFQINAPNLETLYHRAINHSNITYASFPNLKNILKGNVIGTSPFYECSYLKVIDLPNLVYSEINSLMYKCDYVQYMNIPRYTGIISTNSSYDFLNYYNVSKESAISSGIDYKDVNALGGSIRVTDGGLRFGFSFDESQSNKVEEYGFIYSSGSADESSLIIENVDNKSVMKIIAKKRITHEDNTTTFNLVFTNIPKTAYDVSVSVRAYVKIDGMYFYSPVTTRSFNDVAKKIIADDEMDQKTKDEVNSLLEEV